jgi:ABC-type glycerol-3-phosphate transport system permease component
LEEFGVIDGASHLRIWWEVVRKLWATRRWRGGDVLFVGYWNNLLVLYNK